MEKTARRLTIYLFHYRYDGVAYCTEVPAYSLDEARGRLRVMPLAQYDGELVLRIPAFTGSWLPDLICRVRSALKSNC